MAGENGKEAKDSGTSYIAPVKKAMLTKNCVYEYDYYILIGELDQMHKAIYALHQKI